MRAFLLALALACGSAAGAEVGFVSHVAGEVTYAIGNGSAQAKPFMTLREGERFSVNPGAQVRIVYYQGGRQESYAGPVSFTIGTLESVVRSGAQPQVGTLPEGVPQKISQTPELVQIAKLGTSRAIRVRSAREQRLSPQQLAEVRQAREIYEQLRQSAPADDITPELYLYSVLHDNLAYNEMRPVVAEMQRRQPDNADVAVIADYVRAKTGR